MSTTNARWRWLALLAVFAMIVAACSSDTTDDTTDAGDDTATTTTAAPATTAATDDGDDTPSAEGFTYNIAIFSDPQTTNPWDALDTNNDVWTNYVLNGSTSLYGYQGPTYSLTPALAADASPPAVAADGDQWSVTVNLADDRTWSDGEAMDANDVVFTFNTVKKYDGLGGNFPSQWPLAREDDPATEDDESSLGVVSVEALDDYTVKIFFNFDAGLAMWPFQPGTGAVFPEHFWGPIVDANDTFEGLYATEGIDAPQAGGYSIAEVEPGAFWRNDAVDNYFDAGSNYRVYANGAVEYAKADGTTEVYGPPITGSEEVVADYIEGPFASEAVYSLYSDQNSAVLALTDGEVDFLLNPLGLQRGLQQLVLSEPALNVLVNEQLGYRYLAFNTRKFPMSEKSFRQALACRIDKEFMANTVLGGAAIAANSQVPPGNGFWANPDLVAICEGLGEQERFEQAVQILSDAGWTWDVTPVWNEDNRDVLPKGEGLRGPDGSAVAPLELLAPGPGYDPLRATYSLFIEEWAVDLGIPLTAEPTGFSVIVDQVFPPAEQVWDMYILGWGLTPFPDYVFDFFASANDASDGGFNTPGYSNPEFDALYDEFRSVKTLEEARDLILQADSILNEDLPYVVLFTTPIIEAYRNSIEFPFTSTLDGVQNWAGLVTSVRSAS